MKGIVLSVKHTGRTGDSARRVLSVLFGNRALLAFAAALLCGMVLGVCFAVSAGESMSSSLDFLFMTNLTARLNQSVFGTFCACFASDFLFLLGVYLLGFAPWGVPFVCAAILFKGFGTGLAAGHLASAYSLSGVGFYLLIMLPGTFLFCLSLVKFSVCAFDYSKNIFLLTVKKSTAAVFERQRAAEYSARFLSALIITFLAATVDTALWSLFAGTFNF